MKQFLLAGAALPDGEPDFSALPRRVDKRTAAEYVSHYYFPISHRTIESWPLQVRYANGKALFETGRVAGTS